MQWQLYRQKHNGPHHPDGGYFVTYNPIKAYSFLKEKYNAGK
jgi:hypothetical protein